MINSKGLAVGLVLVSIILAAIPTVDARNCLDCDQKPCPNCDPSPDSPPRYSSHFGIDSPCVNVKACFADE